MAKKQLRWQLFPRSLKLPTQLELLIHVLEACGDGNAGIFKIKWTTWDTLKAEGIGFYGANDCKPYCAAGKFHYKKVKVILNNPMVIKGKTYLTSINWWELDKSGQIKNGGDVGGWNLYSNFRMMQGKL